MPDLLPTPAVSRFRRQIQRIRRACETSGTPQPRNGPARPRGLVRVVRKLCQTPRRSSGSPTLPHRLVSKLADAYTHAMETRRVVGRPRAGRTRANRRHAPLASARPRPIAVRKIVVQLDHHRALINAVRNELLDLERLRPSVSTAARSAGHPTLVCELCEQDELRNVHRLVSCAKNGSDFRIRCYLRPLPTTRASRSEERRRQTALLSRFEFLVRNLMPQLSDATASLASSATRANAWRNASTNVTLKIAMGSTVHISLSDELPPASLEGGVRALQALAHLGAFGPDGRVASMYKTPCSNHAGSGCCAPKKRAPHGSSALSPTLRAERYRSEASRFVRALGYQVRVCQARGRDAPAL